MAKQIQYIINADGIKSLEDVIEVFRCLKLGVTLNEKGDKELITRIEDLCVKGLMVREDA